MSTSPFAEALRQAAARHEDSYAEEGAVAPVSLHQRARRRRRMTIGGAVASSMVLVALAVGAVAALDRGMDEPLIPAQVSPAPGTYIEYTPSWADTSWGVTDEQLCTGDFVVATPSEDYVIEVGNEPITLTNWPGGGAAIDGGSAQLQVSADAPARTVVARMRWVIERDGRTIGLAGGYEISTTPDSFAPFATLTPGASMTLQTYIWGVQGCGGEDPIGLSPGEYQIRPLIHLASDDSTAAAGWLAEHGLDYTMIDYHGYRPQIGSWECRNNTRLFRLGVAATCREDTYVTEDGTILVPLDPSTLPPPLTTLIEGPPMTLIVRGEPMEHEYVDLERSSPPVPIEGPITCSSPFSDVTTTESIQPVGYSTLSSIAWDRSFSTHLLGTPELDGKAAFLGDWTGWLGYYDEFGARHPLGHGVLEFERGTVEFDRYAGPTSIEFRFADEPEWCDGAPPADPNAYNQNGSITITLEGTLLLIAEDGSTRQIVARIDLD